MMGEHQAIKEQVGLEFGFSFGKTCLPGQYVDDIWIKRILKFFG